LCSRKDHLLYSMFSRGWMTYITGQFVVLLFHVNILSRKLLKNIVKQIRSLSWKICIQTWLYKFI
jgi:hypothetical protein